MLSCSCWLVLINVACKDSCHPFCLEWHDDPVWQRLSHSSCSTWKSKSWLLCLWPWREMALSTGHRWGCHFASLWLTQADLLWDVTSFCLQDLFAHSVCFCSKVTWKTELLLAGVKEWISLWKLSAKCLSPSLISERTGSLFTRSALWQFYAIPCSLFLYLVFPCPCFVVWSKGNERKIFFFLLLCLFCLGVYHRCSDRDMNSQRIAPSEIKTAILSAFPGKFYQDVWGIIFKQFLQAVQMTNHLQWPSKTLCIRPQRTARGDQLCKTV